MSNTTEMLCCAVLYQLERRWSGVGNHIRHQWNEQARTMLYD